MLDVVLESVRAVVLFGIVVFLWHAGRNKIEKAGKGWNLIVGGFALLLFGSMIDISDNFEGLNFLVVLGDTNVEAFLEEFVGLLGGVAAVAVGLMIWIPNIQRRDFGLFQRQAVEVALGESEARFDAIAGTSNVGIFITRVSDGTYLHFNAAGAELFGTTVEDLAHRSSRDFYQDAADREALMAELRRGPVRNRELKFKKVDGSTIWVLDSVTWIKFKGENALLSTVTDITEQKLAQEALGEAHRTLDQQVKERTSELRQTNDRLKAEILERKLAANAVRRSEEKFSTAFRMNPDSIIITRASDGTILDANDNCLEMLGYGLDEMKAKDAADLWGDPGERKIFQRLMQQSGSVNDFEFVVVDKGGGRHVALLSGRFIEFDGVDAVLTIAHDITELKAKETQLRYARDEAEFANRSKSEFLSIMSHELRTPLNAILGFSEMMKSEVFGPLGDPKYGSYAEDIHASGEHLLELVSDILDLSKIEAGKDKLEAALVDMPPVLKAVATLVGGQADAANIRLETQVSGQLPHLLADKRKLKQILVNLLSNAIKFTNAGGVIRLNAFYQEGKGMILQVEDTGIGMAPEDIPTAMSQFGQIGDAMTQNHEGVGIGLPLTNTLVQQHGGTLTLESEVGVGTTVTACFPPERTSWAIDEDAEHASKSNANTRAAS